MAVYTLGFSPWGTSFGPLRYLWDGF